MKKFTEYLEESVEVLNEMPMPQDWSQEAFAANAPFSKKIAYATDRAKKIGTGSSRVGFIVQHEGRDTVLKIAKNKKGVAQNKREIEVFGDGYFSKNEILIPVIDWDESDSPQWIHMEMAQKMTPSAFKKFFNCTPHDLVLWGHCMMSSRKSRFYTCDRIRSNYEPTEHADSFHDLITGLGDEELGDYGRLANWGIFDGKPVILDVGLDLHVYETYYKLK